MMMTKNIIIKHLVLGEVNGIGVNSLERILEKITPKYPEIEENYSSDLADLGYSYAEEARESIKQEQIKKQFEKEKNIIVYFFLIPIALLVISFLSFMFFGDI